jgi:hypothetical protein
MYSIAKCKTAKIIKGCENGKDGKSKKIPVHSLNLITSEKLMSPTNTKEGKDCGELLIKKPKVLNKNGSQKLIF